MRGKALADIYGVVRTLPSLAKSAAQTAQAVTTTLTKKKALITAEAPDGGTQAGAAEATQSVRAEVPKRREQSDDVADSQADLIRGVDARTLNRSHEISGRSSSSQVNDIAADMRQSGYKGPPIDVVESDGQYYIIDRHHRAAAARRTGTPVDMRVVTDLANHPSSYRSIEEVVGDAKLVGPDRLTHPNRYKK